MHASDLPLWFVRAAAFVFGALWGSFANVVIYRWPREQSVVWPGSHCVACGKPVRGYDNVPIFAWLWLRGRCRDCGVRISPRYPVVELLFAVVSLAIASRVFASALPAWVAAVHYVVRFTVAFALLVATFIDLDEMIVPWFIKWFAPVPLLAAALLPVAPPGVGLVAALAGAGLGYLGLRLLFIDGYKLVTGRRGMGLGDAEILLLVGALVGVPGVLFALVAGATQGVVATVVVMLFRGRLGPADDTDDTDDDDDEPEDADETDAGEHAPLPPLPPPSSDDAPALAASGSDDRPLGRMKVPFVPFLAIGALEYLLGADAVIDVYLRWMTGGA
jgi:leader peptidase (prepilin peptidase)/N-methyltransferase